MRALSYGSGASPYQEIGAAGGVGGRELVAILLRETASWTADRAGTYTFYNFAPGGIGGMTKSANASVYATPAASGGAQKKTVRLSAGQQVGISIGATGYASDNQNELNPPGPSTITFPGGATMTAYPGERGKNSDTVLTAAAGGTATGGDVNISGNPGPAVQAGDGAAAPVIDGIGGWAGGPGVQANRNPLVGVPAGIGAGSGGTKNTGGSTVVAGSGGAGIVLIFREP